jgi:hypothetical protein
VDVEANKRRNEQKNRLNASTFYRLDVINENNEHTSYSRKTYPHHRQSILQEYGRWTDFIMNSKDITKRGEKNNDCSLRSKSIKNILQSIFRHKKNNLCNRDTQRHPFMDKIYIPRQTYTTKIIQRSWRSDYRMRRNHYGGEQTFLSISVSITNPLPKKTTLSHVRHSITKKNFQQNPLQDTP